MKHLITGATGTVGSRVVERLLERAQRPRVFVRDAERARARFGDRVDVAVGDFDDRASLQTALRGCDALFLLNTGPELAQRDAAAAQLAAAAGVKRLVKLSAVGARASGEPTAVALWHARGEDAIRASTVPYTFVQCVGFMSNTLAWAASIKAAGVVRASTGDGRIAMIHPDDIADVVVEVLTSAGYVGQAFAITGPEALSYADMTQRIADAIARPLRFEAISDADARTNLISHGLPPALADALVVLWREVREGKVTLVTGEVERVLGRKPISFTHWARANAAAFRA